MLDISRLQTLHIIGAAETPNRLLAQYTSPAVRSRQSIFSCLKELAIEVPPSSKPELEDLLELNVQLCHFLDRQRDQGLPNIPLLLLSDNIVKARGNEDSFREKVVYLELLPSSDKTYIRDFFTRHYI